MIDLRQAEVLVSTAARKIPRTEQFIQQTENEIRLLLGENPGEISRGQPLTEQVLVPEVPAGLPSSLLASSTKPSAAAAFLARLPPARAV